MSSGGWPAGSHHGRHRRESVNEAWTPAVRPSEASHGPTHARLDGTPIPLLALAPRPDQPGDPLDDPLLEPWRDQLTGLDDPWPAGPAEIADDPLDLPAPPPPSVVAALIAGQDRRRSRKHRRGRGKAAKDSAQDAAGASPGTGHSSDGSRDTATTGDTTPPTEGAHAWPTTHPGEPTSDWPTTQPSQPTTRRTTTQPGQPTERPGRPDQRPARHAARRTDHRTDQPLANGSPAPQQGEPTNPWTTRQPDEPTEQRLARHTATPADHRSTNGRPTTQPDEPTTDRPNRPTAGPPHDQANRPTDPTSSWTTTQQSEPTNDWPAAHPGGPTTEPTSGRPTTQSGKPTTDRPNQPTAGAPHDQASRPAEPVSGWPSTESGESTDCWPGQTAGHPTEAWPASEPDQGTDGTSGDGTGTAGDTGIRWPDAAQGRAADDAGAATGVKRAGRTAGADVGRERGERRGRVAGETGGGRLVRRRGRETAGVVGMDVETMPLALVPFPRSGEAVVGALATPPTGLRKFDLGTVPASVTPPRTWRTAAWFAVGTSAAVVCGLALAAVWLVGPQWPGQTIDALPAYPTRPLEIERLPADETSGVPATSTSRRTESSSPRPEAGGAMAPSESSSRLTAASPAAAGGEATGAGQDMPVEMGEPAAVMAAASPPQRTTVGRKPVTPTAPQAMGDRTEQYFALVTSDPSAAYELCTGSMAKGGPEAIEARYRGVSRVEVVDIVIDRSHAVTTSTVRLHHTDGRVTTERHQLTFTWGGDPRISDEIVTSP